MIRKIFTVLLLAVTGVAAGASEFAYLAVQLNDDTEVVFKTTDLRFKVSDSKLNVYHTDGTTALSVENLRSMSFTKESSSIAGVSASAAEAVTVYNPSGICVGRFESLGTALEGVRTPGVYLVKSESKTIKIVVGK